MRRSCLTCSLGIVLVAGLALSMGNRPPIHASLSTTERTGGFGGAAHPGDEPLEAGPVVHLAARPMTAEATKVWLKLQQKVDMSFPTDTPLEDVIKYLAKVTEDKQDFPDGIPIYVDPQGLQDADKTMASTITINLRGIPLATTLRLLLKQVGLAYEIQKDGILFITADTIEDMPGDPDALILDNLSALRAEVKALREEIRSHRGTGGLPSGSSPNSIDSKPSGGMGSKGGMM